jgi:hypothetical protein
MSVGILGLSQHQFRGRTYPDRAHHGSQLEQGSDHPYPQFGDGQELAQIPDTTAPLFWAASLSPDGTRIAVDVITNSLNGDLQTTVVLTRSGIPIVSFPNTAMPSWLPDGRLAMCGEDGIVIASAALTAARRVIGRSPQCLCRIRPSGHSSDGAIGFCILTSQSALLTPCAVTFVFALQYLAMPFVLRQRFDHRWTQSFRIQPRRPARIATFRIRGRTTDRRCDKPIHEHAQLARGAKRRRPIVQAG